MSIITKYLTGEIFKYFGIILVTVICIFLAVDFFEKIDNFIEAGLPFSTTIRFFQLRIPFIITQLAPVCILLAVLIVFGLMNKNNEMIALKGSGVSVYFFLRPVFSIGLLFSVLLFFLSDTLVPITMNKANAIWLKEVKKKSAVVSREKNIWIKDNRSILHIKYYNPSNKTISGATLYYFDKDYALVRRIDARKGFYKNGQWIFHEIMEQIQDRETGNYQTVLHPQRIEKLDFLPDDLKRVIKKSEEMNFKELYLYIKSIESEGYDATTYKVDLNAKIAFPFICIIMCLLATGISIRVKKGRTLSICIIYGIGIIFLYWILYSFCLSLGYGGLLPPVIAVWMANLIFLSLGGFILLNAE
ncbi:MAG: LPS export ABC transporter permease LptG [Thermodesulfobacteriota bacterium]|nr:LPS export ABC transporter permease LptG [Thermodesulfobacteriota bacterium]